jgi:hypothetical protein
MVDGGEDTAQPDPTKIKKRMTENKKSRKVIVGVRMG